MLQSITPSIALDCDVFCVDNIAEWGSYNEDKGHSRHHSYNVIPVFLNCFYIKFKWLKIMMMNVLPWYILARTRQNDRCSHTCHHRDWRGKCCLVPLPGWCWCLRGRTGGRRGRASELADIHPGRPGRSWGSPAGRDSSEENQSHSAAGTEQSCKQPIMKCLQYF